MKIAVAGSIARDHLMTFPGKFTDAFLENSLESLSLSFLVDGLEIRRGGTGANISFGLGLLGINPILITCAGKDFGDYQSWLQRHGVDTSNVRISEDLLTATFTCTTDSEMRQIASFFPGAMSEGREIELAPILEKSGGLDLLIISPDDPEAMLRHTESSRKLGLDFAADPSQTLASINGDQIKRLITGAKFLFSNEYELGLILQKTGWSEAQLLDQVEIRVTTFGAKGSRIDGRAISPITVGVPKIDNAVDPTGVGDSFRAGFVAAHSWDLDLQSCAQTGAVLAAYCLETKGPQEYRITKNEFLKRFEQTFGQLPTKLVTADF